MLSWDQGLFHFINYNLANGFFDWFFPIITSLHKNPFFVFAVLPLTLAFWIYYKRKQALLAILGLILCVAITDNVNHRILKPYFHRQRPSEVEPEVILRKAHNGGFSFPSNHAANNFAAASFLKAYAPSLGPSFYAVAGLVAFSRVYVGVHYPLDVIIGGLWGALFATFFFRFWKKFTKRFE